MGRKKSSVSFAWVPWICDHDLQLGSTKKEWLQQMQWKKGYFWGGKFMGICLNIPGEVERKGDMIEMLGS